MPPPAWCARLVFLKSFRATLLSREPQIAAREGCGRAPFATCSGRNISFREFPHASRKNAASRGTTNEVRHSSRPWFSKHKDELT
jgi:hypothetical protein